VCVAHVYFANLSVVVIVRPAPRISSPAGYKHTRCVLHISRLSIDRWESSYVRHLAYANWGGCLSILMFLTPLAEVTP